MSEQMIGVIAAGRIAAGLVEGNAVQGRLHRFPAEGAGEIDEVHSMPMEALAEQIAIIVKTMYDEHSGAAALGVGVGFPGIVRNGVIEESPNLKQAKGCRLGDLLSSSLRSHGLELPVCMYNDADVTAAGMAATRGQLERLIRVWTLGHGIGFGRYPYIPGIWEGGHMVVTLDAKETYCGCGGKGHLEGIMGQRSMRLRFLDLEPEEIFENAAEGDTRCTEFELLWHRALAAASASSIHMEGPGKFFISGSSARFVKTSLLSQYLHEMVTMTALQGSVFEVVPTNNEIAVIGAAVNAAREVSHPD